MIIETVCHEQTVMTRVAGNIQLSSRRNSGSRRLVLKPLDTIVVYFLLYYQGAPGNPGPSGLTGAKGAMVSKIERSSEFPRHIA